ncbi:DUF1642 domain-containing protein [Listeria seeligeri]|uniref:DUF1642 domain-containing protein n=2 Tax=Listeria TaxID=1637 RepID=UPI001629F33E|nr:DUF1642 domain-containing protein [Listeria seeligeri]MBC2071790.1 DUF1642 domain-containing protein [Listeria seeligeri]
MKFKEGDKVQFIREGSLIDGVVKEFKDCSPDMWYLIDDKCKDSWIFEGHLIPLTPLPVIPQFVADWIEYCKKHCWGLSEALEDTYENSCMPEEVMDWFEDCRENQELFARAWLDGYEVEKEPLYYVKLGDSGLDYLNVDERTEKKHVSNKEPSPNFRVKFTEKEIKNMNINYWAFRVPVEDLEETE